ncbi:hypothetical protein GOBAR_AA17012 [Gossypium barbadense]|uniref:Uncharacterized protein n=1 Tax=Gossypium barbadense TaxID=3634 RepID=A0A2P5XJV5_GOSBA|nr:hypothetical protein GOBAR_AA17012 [Gossypium barbadense]
MIDVSATGIDSLLVCLKRQIVGGDFSDGNLWLCFELFPQDRRLAITQQYWEELIDLEEGFEKELTLLMEKYNPDRLEEETTDSLEGRDKRGARDIETE